MKSVLTLVFLMYITSLLLAQKAKVVLSIEPTRIEVGETITITITSNVEGNMEIDNLPASFIQDYGISQGSQDKINYNTGEVETTYYYAYSGSITKAGKYTIGPVYVKSYNKVYTSNKVQITVDPKHASGSSGHITQKQMKDPAFGMIECNKTEIYEGEAVLLCAKVYSQFDPSHISGYQNYSVPGTVNKFPQGNQTNIKVGKEQVHNKVYYSFQYDKNVFFPSGVGKIHIDPFQLSLHQGYKSFPITSGGFNLTIKPLPSSPPKSFIGAVGNFSVKTSIDSLVVKQGNVLTYTVIISGVGNLNNLIEPKLVLPKNMIIYGDPERIENFTIAANGADGEVEFNYHIQLLSNGKQEIPAIELTYFDPKKEKYITISGSKHPIDVVKDPTFNTPPQANETEIDDLSENEPQTEKVPKEDSSRSGLWNVLIIGIPALSMAVILFVFLFRKRSQKAPVTPSIPRIDRSSRINEALRNAENSVSNSNAVFFDAVQHTIGELFLLAQPGRESLLSQSEMESALEQLGQGHEIQHLRELIECVIHNKYGLGDSTVPKDQVLRDLKAFVSRVLPRFKG